MGRGGLALLLALCCVGAAWGMRPNLDASIVAEKSSDALLTLAQANPEVAFNLFAVQQDKSYKDDKSSEEYQLRLNIFQSNVEKVRAHNAGQSSYKMALNQFADLTEEEFKAQFLGVHPTKRGTFRAREAQSPFSYAAAAASEALPEKVDWRTVGAVTGVKNQQACGSCWAFSTTGSIEGINFLKTGQLVSLSEQELVDCDREHDLGCNGGLMDYAFEFVVENGGLDTEEDYAYWSGAGTGLWCNKRRENRTVVSIDSYEDVPENDEKSLQAAVAGQPVSVAICASPLMFYSSGILDTCCTDLDHGVLAVGYGVEEGTPYWLVKNSWGASWGEEGYFKLKAFTEDPQGTCGIAMAASYPVKTHPNHPTIDVCGWFGWSECAAGSKCRCDAALLSAWEYYTCYSWGCQPEQQS